MKPRKRINPISERQKERLKEYAKVRRKFLKDRKCAVRRCTKPADDVHHKRGKIGSLLTNTTYFVGLCRWHHHYVHSNPKLAQENGLLCQPGEWGKQEP